MSVKWEKISRERQTYLCVKWRFKYEWSSKIDECEKRKGMERKKDLHICEIWGWEYIVNIKLSHECKNKEN